MQGLFPTGESRRLPVVMCVVIWGALFLSCGGSTTNTGTTPPAGTDAGGPQTDAMVMSDAATGVDHLFFVVGDTRPANPDDVSGYPTDIIQQIFAGISGRNPLPQFVIGTGDYQFSFSGSTSAAQMDLFLAARNQFSGPYYPTMGNHECTGATASNCGGSGSTDGMTQNYGAFLSKMLGPVNQTNPYYALNVTGTNNAWTAKFLFVAANAWSTDQATWLDMAMSQPTTYTFIVRHESSDTSEAPGVDPSQQIMAKHPYTMAIVGHSHTFRRNTQQEIIIGNGGAPPSGSVNYGYGLFTQQPDGTIQVEMIDYQSGQSSQAFSIKADGSSA